MGDPYRDAGGVACPRCKAMAAMEDDGGVTCTNGCGAWIPHHVIVQLVGTRNLATSGVPAPFFKVVNLPPTRCLRCTTPLAPLYRVAGDDYLTIGQCADHGIWLEQRGRVDFELAFRREILEHRVAETQVTAQTQEAEELAEAIAGDTREMARRIVALERHVAALTARLDALSRR